MASARRTTMIGAWVIGAWFVAIVAFWALRPLTVRVPVGVDYTGSTPAAKTVRVRCNTLFASHPLDDSSLPTLKPQPAGKPALEYPKDPCGLVHGEARTLLAVDTLTVLVLGGAAIAWHKRVRRHEAVPAALPA